MLKRKMEEKIRYFFSTQKKALLITGARQTGKTFVIRQYAKSTGKNLAERSRCGIAGVLCFGTSIAAFTKSSQKNQHSTIDSANNECYSTCRTKERDTEGTKKEVPGDP